MKKSLFTFLIFLSWVSFTHAANAPVTSSSPDPQQMLGFSLSGYGSKGQKSWEVQGASMDMLGDEIEISDMTAYLYGEDENMVLTADRGRFDKVTGQVRLRDNVEAVTDSGTRLNTEKLNWFQKQRLITSDDRVKITRDTMTAVATGLEAEPDLKKAIFQKDVTVTLDEDAKTEKKSSSASMPSKIVITCDGPLEISYEKNFAVFKDNVKVEGGLEQGTMHSDQMTIYFNADEKKVEKMEAVGHVKIEKGESTSFSESAIFIAVNKTVILTGRPKLVIYTEEDMDVSS